MPHILIDHDASLREVLDRRRFAHELHALAAKKVDGITVESCKTRFRCVEDVVIAHDQPRQALIHVDFAILPGRATETRQELGQAVLDLVRAHTANATGLTVHASVEVRDLDAAYAKHVEPATTGQ
ncbi:MULTISPECIES: 5-carboxymethyl-2-hydroxymuconate Delta-isomerase [unclassified Streptomyces]|uniref:5-carboxymethyl-2-hydroxymuconate Delta-isomerase n=1 Tax=unclassified Streptomyces TaxID=2593676 RepID=UPI000C27D480|nr:isomerase [Streptomyces sp. CB02959]PJN38406.1 isomerase [Streptomyces sp. CB02959]